MSRLKRKDHRIELKSLYDNWGSRLLAVSLCCSLLTACANLAGPDYERPTTAAKLAWSVPTPSPTSVSATIRLDWWRNFSDPYLNELVAKALAGSPDIKILLSRIESAGVNVELEQVSNIPTLGLGTSAGVTRTNLGDSQSYNVNASGLNWEADIWGKLRKGINAQKAEYKASEADYRAGYLTLISEVAQNYFEIRNLDERITAQQKAFNKGQRILGIYRNQQKEGLVAQTKVLQQRAEGHSQKRELLNLRRQRAVAENKLATLLGLAAGTLKVPHAALSKSVRIPKVPAGLPSDLLKRRPDIIAAEYRVLKAHQLTQKARLGKLPSVSLTGSGGLASALLSTLLNNWSLGLSMAVNFPIFDPSLNLKIKGSEIEQKISAEEYRKVVIKAFEEVENALVNLAYWKQQERELRRQIANLRVVNNTVYAQLKEGLVSQLDVFESERSLLGAQQSLLQLRRQILDDTLVLYKALGGGWPKETVMLAQQ